MLGEGGMGQVWSARDSRLDRTVAIKVSAEQFTERFEREARSIAALNHPNICTLYDVGPDYLVMELIEGPTLAERIAAGAIPLEEALVIARQIAEALEAAHEKGIVHRDLKPANVKLTAEGKVKVLDFGLAKAREPESAAGDPTMSPTLTISATRAGMILGTAGYMSPEQARGKPVDRRADIWSFGVVLYEMLCGRPLYGGEMASDMLAAVILKNPDWDALPEGTPARVRELLGRCLRKDPKMRMRDIGDARIAIEEYLAKPDVAEKAVAAPLVVRRKRPWSTIAAAVLALGLAGLAAIHFSERAPETATVRLQIPTAAGTGYGNGIAISPDGKRLAFVANSAGRTMLWVRPLESLIAQPLPGTEDTASPFWSPDSRFIGFFVPGKLKKVEASGGPPQTLCDVANTGVGGSWNGDGVIVFGTSASGLFRVSQAGGAAASLTTLDPARGEVFHSRPWFLPDGRHFLYYANSSSPENSGIYLASLSGKDRQRLVAARQGATYAPPAGGGQRGHLLFLRESTLIAQPLDPGSYEPAGDAFPVPGAEQVGSTISLPFFSVSNNGVLVYRAGGPGGNTQLAWFDRQGKLLETVGPIGIYSDVALSPEGKRVAVRKVDPQSGNIDIWLLDVAHGVPTRFTFDPATENYPVWSPDGSRIVFNSTRGGVFDLYQKGSGGTGSEELLLKSNLSKFPYDWSADGKYLLFAVTDPKTRSDLWVLPGPSAQSGERQPRPVVVTPYNETQGQFSPGPGPRWIAYASDESGRYEVYVQPFSETSAAPAGKFQISSEGGNQPRWRRDGKEIYYIAPDGRLMAVEVKTAPQFEHGAPKSLFQTRIYLGGTVVTALRYSPAPDGKRFLINSQAEEMASAPITVVLNWIAGLKR